MRLFDARAEYLEARVMVAMTERRAPQELQISTSLVAGSLKQ